MVADTVFLNGEVVTVDQDDRVAEAVAIERNRIAAVGTNNEVRRLVGSSTRVHDLGGKCLLPGFIDAHMHISLLGTNKQGVSCKEPHIGSVEDVLHDLESQAQRTPVGEWVRAWGFNEAAISEGRYPTLAELDAVSDEHPVLVGRTCGHISVVNSRALERARIDADTKDPSGGKIERDEKGHPTGLLLEAAHMNMMGVAAFGEEELRQAIISRLRRPRRRRCNQCPRRRGIREHTICGPCSRRRGPEMSRYDCTPWFVP